MFTLNFLIRRLTQGVVIIGLVSLLIFTLLRVVPGDPVRLMAGGMAPEALIEKIAKDMGLRDPIIVQFGRYLFDAAQFKFGVSYQFRQPVSDLLKERMPATPELAICATILALFFGIIMGVFSALRRDSLMAKLFQMVSLIGISLPTFLIGILLIYLFSVTLGWLPSFGRGDVVKL
ncbi:MAG: ABC transporter permease, partial [Bradyrhizobium sp.]|nr:ABC transporter permease [Bradyrhizobium sp.]